MDEIKYIRHPGPGNYRGTGAWHSINEKDEEQVQYWEWCKRTGYLPVAFKRAPDCCDVKGFAFENGELIHVQTGFGKPLRGISTKHLEYAQAQLKALIEQETKT